MKRLRAVAAILALAVIWLGYSVAREIAAERAWHAPVELQATSEPAPWTEGAPSKPVRPAIQFPAVPKSAPRSPYLTSAGLSQGTPQAITVPSPEAPAVATAPVEPLPTSPAHVPFFQDALFDAQAGVVPGAQGRPGGVFGGGAMPSMWGGVGGVSAGSPTATDDTGLSGDGRPGVLGHRFLAESGESNDGTGSNANASNGSNGGNGGSNDHNGDANGNGGSNSSNGSNDHNGDGNGNNGKNGDNASNGGNGSNGSSEKGGSSQGGNGGPSGGGDNSSTGGGAGDDGGINSFVANVDEVPNGDVARDIPEPGSILFGLGAAAALLRRRAR
jgi:hypothetical protein